MPPDSRCLFHEETRRSAKVKQPLFAGRGRKISESIAKGRPVIVSLCDVFRVPSVETVRAPKVILRIEIRLLISLWLGPEKS
jgi:hypothetical protein